MSRLSRKWYKCVCKCGNCNSIAVLQLPFGTPVVLDSEICKRCGVKGKMAFVELAKRKAKQG